MPLHLSSAGTVASATSRLSTPSTAASSTGPLTVLGLYAGIGLAVILASNALANRTREHSVAGELALAGERDDDAVLDRSVAE